MYIPNDMSRKNTKVIPEVERAYNEARQLAALQLRLKGHTYADIVAEGIYTTISAASNAIGKAVRSEFKDTANEVREFESMRLELLMKPYWSKALGGDVSAANFILKVLERRAKMLGLDAPLKVDISDMISDAAKAAGLDPVALAYDAKQIVTEMGSAQA